MKEDKIGMESLYIPKEIMKLLQNRELSPQEAIILSIIDFLDSKGECYASNEFFGKSIGVSTDRARKIITSLYNKKYINRKVIYKNGTMEVDKRILKANIKTTKVELNNPPMVENSQGVRVNITRGTGKKDHIEKSVVESSNIIYISFTKIFNLWNSKGIINHKRISDNMVKAYNKALNTYTENEIVEAIENYSRCFNDNKFYYDYKFTLESFLKSNKGISNFVNEGQVYINYLNQNNKKAPVGAGATNNQMQYRQKIYGTEFK